MATRNWAEDPALGYPGPGATYPFAAEAAPRGVRSFVLDAALAQSTNDVTAGLSIGGGEVSIDLSGTFGASGAVALEGSDDPTNPVSWSALHNDAGTAISMTAAGIYRPIEKPYAIRCRVTGGDGTTALTARARVTAPPL